MRNIKLSLWALLSMLFISLFSPKVLKAQTSPKVISCSHPELCHLSRLILNDYTNTTAYTFQTLVDIVGDPHEYEPGANEIKKLITAEFLLVGPHELNPWIKRINFQRSKIKGVTTLALPLNEKDYGLYPEANYEALSHFWLYPKIFCLMKERLTAELLRMKVIPSGAKEVESKNSCLEKQNLIQNELAQTLSQIKEPIVLTHDALLPLLVSLDKSKKHLIVAVKGSGHHQEATPASVKKLYDALKAPRVIWVEEKNIHIPSNLLAKKRNTDIVLSLDTAKSEGMEYFHVLKSLNAKLQALK